MDSIISTFHIDWKIIIAQAINFGIVFTVLYIYALKPLSKLMVDRSEKISKGVDDAKKSTELLDKASEEYRQNTIKLRQLAESAKAELGKELEQIRTENLDKIKADNDEWAKKRQTQMEIDKKALVEGAKGEIMSLAMLTVEKLIKEKENLNDVK